jgi:hypothetical protein
MARALNSCLPMRVVSVPASLFIALFLAACQREAPPRDYQNNPPAMTHPVTSSSQSPAARGMKGPAPEPSRGVEGKNITRKPISPVPPTLTLKDQPPATKT